MICEPYSPMLQCIVLRIKLCLQYTNFYISGLQRQEVRKSFVAFEFQEPFPNGLKYVRITLTEVQFL